MKIIITENQLKNKVHQMVKTEGWYDTCEIMGLSGKDLAQLFFNNDPMEYLNLFSNLNPIEQKNLIRFKDDNGTTLVFFPHSKIIYFNRHKIYMPLKFSFDTFIPENTFMKWVETNYNLNPVKIDWYS